MTPMPPPTPPPTYPVSLSDLLMGYMTVPAGTYTVTAGMTENVGHATFSCPTGGANCMITVMANGTVTSRGGQATAMPSPTARAAKMAADEAARQAAAAAKKKTDGLIMAIKESRARRDFAEVFGDVFGGFSISPSQVVVTPEVWETSWPVLQGIAIGREPFRPYPNTPNPLGDVLDKDDTALADNMEFMNRNMNTTLGQFAGEVHKRERKDGNKTTIDEIQIYHDKKASGPVKYSEYYSSGSTLENRATAASGSFPDSGPQVNRNARLGVSSVNYANNANGVLTIKSGADATTDALTAAETALFSATNFPSVNNQTFTYGGSTAGAKDRTFDGTFNGVAGKYTCTGTTTCSATKLSNGNLHFQATGGSNAGWTFAPTKKANEILLPGLDHDTDYLVFGYWVQTVEQPDKDTTYKVGVIRRGSKPFGSDTSTPPNDIRNNPAIEALRGKATYNGSAAGKYGLNVLSPDGSVTSASAGSFTAKTTLMAQFGDTSGAVSVNDQYSIRGTITDFTDPRNPGTDLSAWRVELQRAKFGFATGSSVRAGEESHAFPLTARGAENLGGGGARGMTGTTPGPSVGIWNGQFFGPTGSGAAAASTHPTGVAGFFKASFINGDVVGGFGATRE